MPKKKYCQRTMSFSTAKKKLNFILHRVDEWNDFFSTFFGIKSVLLVGSVANGALRVSDVDICIETEVNCSPESVLSKRKITRYLKKRSQALGELSEPRNLFELFFIMENDPIKFIQNDDSFIDVMDWKDRHNISLTLSPQVMLMANGKRVFKSIDDALLSAKPIKIEQAIKIIDGDAFKIMPSHEHVLDYVRTLKNYPFWVRERILNRDETHQVYRLNLHKV